MNIKNDITKQINKAFNKSQDDSAEPSKPHDFKLVEGVLDLFSGGGGTNAVAAQSGGEGQSGIGGLQQILDAVQGAGGILPGLHLPEGVNKFLPTIMKVAEVIGKGTGDDTPRVGTNTDGTIVDEFVKTQVDGRKIHAGGGSRRVMELTSVQTKVSNANSPPRNFHPSEDLLQLNPMRLEVHSFSTFYFEWSRSCISS